MTCPVKKIAESCAWCMHVHMHMTNLELNSMAVSQLPRIPPTGCKGDLINTACIFFMIHTSCGQSQEVSLPADRLVTFQVSCQVLF